MRSHLAGMLATCLLAAGCAGVGPGNEAFKPTVQVSSDQTIAAAPDVVVERARTFLGAQRFSVAPTAEGLRGSLPAAANETWAICERPTVTDPTQEDSRRRREAMIVGRDAEVVLAVAPAGDGTEASVQTAFGATMKNTFINVDFDVRCRSTGFLERDLFEALRASPASARKPQDASAGRAISSSAPP